MNAKEQWLVDTARFAVEAVIEHLRAHSGVGDSWDSIETVLKEQITEECEDLVVDVLEERGAVHVPAALPKE